MPDVAVLSARVTADTASLEAGMSRATKSVADFASAANKVGDVSGSFDKLATVGAVIGTSIAAGVGLAVKSASDLQTAVAKISTIKPEIDTSKVTTSIQQMTTRVAQSSGQLADSLYNVFSSIEVSQEGAIALTEKFAKGAVAAKTDAETFGTSVLGVMNAYKLSVSDADHVSDVFFNTVNKGVITGAELASNLGNVSQSAKNAGVNFDTLGALIAGVTKEGGSASVNVNNLNNVLQKLVTADVQNGLKELGIQTQNADGSFRDILGTLTDLKAKLDELPQGERAQALQKLFPDAQARTGIQTLLSQLDTVKQVANDNAKAVGVASDAYAKMGATAAAQATILKNTLIATVGQFGTEALPGLITMGQGLQKIVQSFSELPSSLKGAIVTGAELAAVFLLVGAASIKVVGTAVEIAGALRTVAVSVGALSAAGGGGLIGLAGALSSVAVASAVAVGALVVINKTVESLTGQSIPGAIASLLKYGDAWSKGHEQAQKSFADHKGDFAALTKDIDGATEQIAQLQDKILAINSIGLGQQFQNFLAHPFSDGGLRDLESARSNLQAYVNDLQALRDKEQALASDRETRLRQGKENFVGPVAPFTGPVLPPGAAEEAAKLATGLNAAASAFGAMAAGVPPARDAIASVDEATANLLTRFQQTAQAGLTQRFQEISGAMQGVTTSVQPLQAAFDLLNQKQAAGIPLTSEQAHLLSTLPGYIAGATSGYDGMVTNLAQVAIAQSTFATTSAAAGSAFGGLGGQAGTLQGALNALRASAIELDGALGALGSQNSKLSGEYSLLNDRIAILTAQQKENKGLSSSEAAELNTLTVARDKLGAQIGTNTAQMRDLVVQSVANDEQTKVAVARMNDLKAAWANAVPPPEAASGIVGLNNGLGAVVPAAGNAATGLAGVTTAANAVPKSVTINTQATNAIKAAGEIVGVKAAIALVPQSFTVVAHVDISQALANIATLSNNIPRSPAKEGPFRKLPDWMALYDQLAPAGDWAIATLGQTTGAMSAALKGAVDEGAKTAAEIASAVARAVQDVIGAGGALSKVNPTSGPTGAQFSWLTATTTALVGSLQAAAASFKADGLKATGEFADVAGRVGGSVKGTLEGLAALAGYDFARSSPTGSAMAWFTHLATSLVANFAVAARRFGEGMLKDASDLADSAGKVGGSIKGTLEGLQALAGANWAKSSPTGSAMGWFTHLAASLVANFAVAAAGFAEGALKSASDLADSASKVGGSVKNVMEGLAALANADWAKLSPSGSAMSWLTHLVTSLVQTYAAAAATFETGALDGAAKLGESVGKVAGSIGPTLAGLKDIATGVAVPTTGQLDAFFVGVRAVFARFAEMAKTLDGEATEQVGKFATSANSVMGAAKSSTDLFRAFAPDKDGKNALIIPGIQAINEVSEGIKAFVAKFAEMATMLTGEGLAKVSAFAGGVSSVVGAAKGSLDLFKTLAETKTMPTNAVIDYLVGSIGYLITQTRTVAAGIGTEGLLQAQQFATGTLTFVTTVKNALELFPKLAELKGLPGKALEEILGAMGAALELAKQNVNVATDILGQSQTYLDIMREAASNFAQGLALGNGIPAGSALGTALAAPASVPALATGGIVTKPTLALIGERGPEAVVPLSEYNRGARGGGGGGAIYVTIEYHDHTMQGTDRARLADFARSLKPELEKVVVASW